MTSTRAFLRQNGYGFRALHGYVYGRWPRLYVKFVLWLGKHALHPAIGKWFQNRYHAKVLSHEHARAVIQLDRDLTVRNPEQVIPFPLARDIILNALPDVVVFDCPCRLNRASPCQPLNVCMVIGKPMTDFTLDHHTSARRLSQAEALAILEAEHARGHVHTAWFKDAMLNRFYAICNCCKCCCGGIQAMKEFGLRLIASSGYVAQIDAALCANCGDCVDACAFGALAAKEDGTVARDWELCMGCGACEVKCATGAITLARDQRKGLPLDVRALA